MFDFRRITLFCSEQHLSKHKMSIFSKNLWRAMAPLAPLPGYAYDLIVTKAISNKYRKELSITMIFIKLPPPTDSHGMKHKHSTLWVRPQ